MALTLEDIYEVGLVFESQEIKDFGATEKLYSCSLVTSQSIFPVPSNQQFCESYYQNTNFFCNSCKFQKSGNVLENSGNKFLDCSIELNDCNNQKYGGFHFDRTAFFTHNLVTERWYSCYICSDAS